VIARLLLGRRLIRVAATAGGTSGWIALASRLRLDCTVMVRMAVLQLSSMNVVRVTASDGMLAAMRVPATPQHRVRQHGGDRQQGGQGVEHRCFWTLGYSGAASELSSWLSPLSPIRHEK
jgi:hypothetical protein